MSISRSKSVKNFDWITLSLYIGLISVGWFMIYTVGYEENQFSSIGLYFSTTSGKQTTWIIFSGITMFLVYVIDAKFWQSFAYIVYGIGIIALISVLIFGIKIKGATSWFSVAGFTFQPSELAKFGTCLAIASYLSMYSVDIRNTKSLLYALSIMLLPMILILLQPDAGSALVFLSFLILFFREGLSANLYWLILTIPTLFILALIYPIFYIIIILLLLAISLLLYNLTNRTVSVTLFCTINIATIIAVYLGFNKYVLIFNAIVLAGLLLYHWINRKQRLANITTVIITISVVLVVSANYTFNNVLEVHQQDRINVWLNPEKCDPRGPLYNVLQSKMAIGSGGFQGKGFLKGTMTKLDYVPEQSTDFIFCTIGEEQGFVGVTCIIAMFVLLFIRLITLGERQKNPFARRYAYGIAGIIFIHFFINIGMTMGLVPIIGIPLPFVSYGGSSLLFFSIMIAVLLKMDAHRMR